MSTNFRKQKEIAEKETRRIRVKIIRKVKKKRVTKQVRVKEEIHRRLSEIAGEEKRTMSRMIDILLSNILKSNQK
jgi:hypothetical protein